MKSIIRFATQAFANERDFLFARGTLMRLLECCWVVVLLFAMQIGFDLWMSHLYTSLPDVKHSLNLAETVPQNAALAGAAVEAMTPFANRLQSVMHWGYTYSATICTALATTAISWMLLWRNLREFGARFILHVFVLAAIIAALTRLGLWTIEYKSRLPTTDPYTEFLKLKTGLQTIGTAHQVLGYICQTCYVSIGIAFGSFTLSATQFESLRDVEIRRRIDGAVSLLVLASIFMVLRTLEIRMFANWPAAFLDQRSFDETLNSIAVTLMLGHGIKSTFLLILVFSVALFTAKIRESAYLNVASIDTPAKDTKIKIHLGPWSQVIVFASTIAPLLFSGPGEAIVNLFAR